MHTREITKFLKWFFLQLRTVEWHISAELSVIHTKNKREKDKYNY